MATWEGRTQHSRFTGGRSRRKPEAVLKKNGTREGLATVSNENALSAGNRARLTSGGNIGGRKSKRCPVNETAGVFTRYASGGTILSTRLFADPSTR